MFYENVKKYDLPIYSCAVVKLIFNHKCLLVQRAKTALWAADLWALPGGKLEKNENAKNAAIREIYEELNVKLLNKHLIFQKQYSVINTEHKNGNYAYYFFTYTLHEYPKIFLSAEHQAFCWVDTKTLPKIDLAEGTQFILEQKILRG